MIRKSLASAVFPKIIQFWKISNLSNFGLNYQIDSRFASIWFVLIRIGPSFNSFISLYIFSISPILFPKFLKFFFFFFFLISFSFFFFLFPLRRGRWLHAPPAWLAAVQPAISSSSFFFFFFFFFLVGSQPWAGCTSSQPWLAACAAASLGWLRKHQPWLAACATASPG